MSKRKLKSNFNLLCEFVNTLAVGTQYTVKEAREYITLRAKELNFDPTALQVSTMAASTQQGLSYIIGCNHVRILTTKCIRRVKHGVYEVVAPIPDWVTVATTDANRGYKKWINGQVVPRGQKWRLGDPEPEKKVKKTKLTDEEKIRQHMPNYPERTIENIMYRVKSLQSMFAKLDGDPYRAIMCNHMGDDNVVISSLDIKNPAMANIKHMDGTTDTVNVLMVSNFRIEKDPHLKINKSKDEVVKSKLMILGQIEGCFKTKGINEAVVALMEGYGPVHVFEISEKNPEMIHISAEGVVDWVEVTKLKDIRIVNATEYRKLIYPERDVFVMRDITPDSYKLGTHLAFVPAKEHSVIVAEQVKMKEQIVSILKEGLSAADAADKIMKLFNK